ncbi:MAG: signal recognition particle receptor subunit alpha [Candidatus Woesearchaeota archaeon]
MVLDRLGEGLRNSLQKVSKSLFVDEKLINELVRDIQRTLIQSDVNVKLVFSLGKKIKERALNEDVPGTLSKKEFLINIVYEELANLVGRGMEKLEIPPRKEREKPYTLMLVGLFGNGKTTTAGKLANYYKKRGKKVALLSIDTWRPAAYDQLKQLGESIKVDVYGDPELGNPEKIYTHFEEQLDPYDLVIVDTAGRDALNDELIEELNGINEAVDADQTFLVINADIGQSAEKQARAFHESCQVTGVILTKLDGTARGGGALAACAVTGTPIRFIGVGEKLDAFEEFKPEGFVGRLLGMGDLESLLEKAQVAVDEDEAKDMGRKFLKGEFNLIDLYQQMKSMKKMGSMTKLMDMIPGFNNMNIPKEALQGQEEKMEDWKILMDSMTREELENPDLIKGSRLDRIAQGAGKDIKDLRLLTKQYKQSKKMMKMMKGSSGSEKDMQKLMQKMGSKKMKF